MSVHTSNSSARNKWFYKLSSIWVQKVKCSKEKLLAVKSPLFHSCANMQSTRRLKCLYRLSTHMHLTFCRCGTCVDGAKPGQHGYCPTRKRKRKLRKPPRKVGGFRSNFQALSPNVGMPSTHENWGLCSMQCLPASISSLRTTTLQVQFWIFAPKTKLSLFVVFGTCVNLEK